jgi:hypothetical protein
MPENLPFHTQIVEFCDGLQFTQDDLSKPFPEILARRMADVATPLVRAITSAANAFFGKFDLDYQRSRAGVLSAISLDPEPHTISDDTFQFLVKRLQFLLDLRAYECKKASVLSNLPIEFADVYENVARLPILEKRGPNDYGINANWILGVIPERLFAEGDNRPQVRDVVRLWYRLAIDPTRMGSEAAPGRHFLPIFQEMHEELNAAAGDNNCFEIYLDLTPEEAERISREISNLPAQDGPWVVFHRLGAPEAFPLREPPPGAEALNPEDPEFPRIWENFVARVIRFERMTEHWRRLRFILSPRTRLSPIGPAISKSGERYYSAASRPQLWRGILRDWLGTLVLWPLFTSVLFAIVAVALAGLGISAWWGVGIACGLLLACAGAQPCSYVLGVMPCGAGSVAMGLFFSIAAALILGGLEKAGALQQIDFLRSLGTLTTTDPFSAVTGGIIGQSAPYWREVLKFPAFLIAFLIASMWGSIILSGWLMAQPRLASPLYKRLARKAAKERAELQNLKGKLARFGLSLEFSREKYIGRPIARTVQLAWRLAAAVLVGGGGIGAIFGLTEGLAPPGPAMMYVFTTAFAIIGGAAAAAVVYRRTASFGKAGIFFLLHACVAVALCSLSFGLAGTVIGLIALSITCGIYNSTFFTASYILGEWLGGLDYAERLAFWAATLESAGFVVKVLLGVISPAHQL